jgi:hypothetical protein
MRAREFVIETTVAGSIATVAQPMGPVIRRASSSKPAKYRNSLTQGKQQKNVSR